MIRTLFAGAALAGAMALTACETYGPTPYQPSTNRYQGGYSETRIENDRFRISFKGNSLTERDTVENYMLYRAAELTLQQGYDTFTMVNRDTDKRDRVRSWPGYMSSRLSYVYFVPRVGWIADYEPYWEPGYYDQVTNYEASSEITLGKGPKGSDPNTFDARDVEKNLGPSIARPPAA